MAKLCPRGKAAAKRKFKVYPSAYANMYASAVCSGKVTPGGKKKRTKKIEGGPAKESENYKMFKKYGSRKKAMGGGMIMDRAMYKGGGACKLAMKGKGRAYGKNS